MLRFIASWNVICFQPDREWINSHQPIDGVGKFGPNGFVCPEVFVQPNVSQIELFLRWCISVSVQSCCPNICQSVPLVTALLWMWQTHILMCASSNRISPQGRWTFPQLHWDEGSVPVNNIPPNTEKWLRKFYMKTMATVNSYENKCATNYSIITSKTGSTRITSSSQCTTSTPMTTLTSTIAWRTTCIESAHIAHCSQSLLMIHIAHSWLKFWAHS